MQEYLAEAYRLAYYQQQNPYISTSALADVLGVSAPAVTRMVQRLRDAGFLEHEPYRGIALTPAGEHEAIRSIRRHRLVEVFLVNVMGLGWHEVHDSADQLGENVSDAVIDRMEVMAGYPRRCPHGEPIPNRDGHMPRVHDIPLNEAALDTPWTISRVNTHDMEKLRYLGEQGLRPGRSLTILERAPFNGPLRLALDTADPSAVPTADASLIGHELAGVLRVCPPSAFRLA
jgi:DtxR family Mn-dependent transcriptional regulator